MPAKPAAAEGERPRAECVDHKASTSEIKNDLAALVEHIRPLREVRAGPARPPPLAAARVQGAGAGRGRAPGPGQGPPGD